MRAQFGKNSTAINRIRRTPRPFTISPPFARLSCSAFHSVAFPVPLRASSRSLFFYIALLPLVFFFSTQSILLPPVPGKAWGDSKVAKKNWTFESKYKKKTDRTVGRYGPSERSAGRMHKKKREQSNPFSRISSRAPLGLRRGWQTPKFFFFCCLSLAQSLGTKR